VTRLIGNHEVTRLIGPQQATRLIGDRQVTSATRDALLGRRQPDRPIQGLGLVRLTPVRT